MLYIDSMIFYDKKNETTNPSYINTKILKWFEYRDTCVMNYTRMCVLHEYKNIKYFDH